MATHYDVLGVLPTSTPAEIRRAYHARARVLHPDGRGSSGLDDAPRAMQDVNEAWRVLRDAASRAAYDRSLLDAASAPATSMAPDEWLDRPYPRRPAEPGDLTIAVVRAAPWIAVLAVLAAVFVFTAFARNDRNADDLVGTCVRLTDGTPHQVPCSGPNDGRVASVVRRAELCASDTHGALVAGEWYCLRPTD